MRPSSLALLALLALTALSAHSFELGAWSEQGFWRENGARSETNVDISIEHGMIITAFEKDGFELFWWDP